MTWFRVLVCLVALAPIGCGSDDSGPVRDAGSASDASTSRDGSPSDSPTSIPDGSSADTINGCTRATAVDRTAMAAVTIEFTGTEYTPACVVVDVGTSVTFSGMFSFHPLSPGTVEGATITPDPSSPIMRTTDGTSATFTMTTAGVYPFYCEFHNPLGMKGAVFVE